jgi:hypothetical protein
MGADTETTQGRTDPLFIVAEIYGCWWRWTNFRLQYDGSPSWNGLLQVLSSLQSNSIPIFLKNISKLL